MYSSFLSSSFFLTVRGMFSSWDVSNTPSANRRRTLLHWFDLLERSSTWPKIMAAQQFWFGWNTVILFTSADSQLSPSTKSIVDAPFFFMLHQFYQSNKCIPPDVPRARLVVPTVSRFASHRGRHACTCFSERERTRNHLYKTLCKRRILIFLKPHENWSSILRARSSLSDTQ